MTIGSLLTASNLTTLNFDLTTPGGSNDLLMVTGNLTLAPNTAITFGTDPTTYGDYRLIGYGSLTGSLSDINLPAGPPARCTRCRRRWTRATSTSWWPYPSLRPWSSWALARSGCWPGRGGGDVNEPIQLKFGDTPNAIHHCVLHLGCHCDFACVPARQSGGRYLGLAGTGDWSVGSNWSGGAVPTSRVNADIYDGGTATITTTGDICSSLTLGNTAGSGAVAMTGGIFSPGCEYVGETGTGTFTQSGGTNNDAGPLYIGDQPGSNGTYVLSGNSLLSVPFWTGWGGETVGYSGVGTFIQSGGTNSIEQFTVGNSWSASGTGTYFLSGPSLLTVSETETVGWGGVGVVNQSGGTNVASVFVDQLPDRRIRRQLQRHFSEFRRGSVVRWDPGHRGIWRLVSCRRGARTRSRANWRFIMVSINSTAAF